MHKLPQKKTFSTLVKLEDTLKELNIEKNKFVFGFKLKETDLVVFHMKF